MKGQLRFAACIVSAAVLILDSRCAAESAATALELCIRTLIPGLFPLFVISCLLVPQLGSASVPGLAKILRIPAGSEGIFLLGTVGGFPVGAACIGQAVKCGGIGKAEAERMLGFCSSCGPAFLFGILSRILRPGEAFMLFFIQLVSALLLAAFWPGKSCGAYSAGTETISLPAAVRRSIGSMALVCAWVILAGTAVGYLRKWLFPLLPLPVCVLVTGLLEITGGSLSLGSLTNGDLRFLLAAAFVCFGGVSVLLQIRALAADAGLSMKNCWMQKLFHGVLGCGIGMLYLRFGWSGILLPILVLFGKIAVEISRTVVYNIPEKGGI